MNNEVNYYIVEFDDGIQIIPKKWVNFDKNIVYWPNFNNFKKFDKAVEEMIDVESSWKSYQINRILGKSVTFQRGKEKLREAEFYSDLSTDQEENKRRKRQKRAKKRGYSSHSSEEDEMFHLPKLPATPSTPSTSVKQRTISENGSCASPGFVAVAEITPKASSTLEDDLGHKAVLRSLSGMRYTLAGIVSSLEEVVQRLDRLEKGREERNNEERDGGYGWVNEVFPINSDVGLQEIEERISNEKCKSEIVNHFKKIGGRDVRNVVYNMLPRMLCDDIANTFSWFGAKGKRAFVSLHLSAIIQDVVRCHFKNATNVEIEGPVKKWLSKAKERLERDNRKLVAVENIENENEDLY